MPMCGLRRKEFGNPRWSSSGSTGRPPSSSGLRWRTSLQSAVELDSSLSATLSLRMTGEIEVAVQHLSHSPNMGFLNQVTFT